MANYGADDNITAMQAAKTAVDPVNIPLEEKFQQLRQINTAINNLLADRRTVIVSIHKAEEVLGKMRAQEISEFEKYLQDTFTTRDDF